MATPHIRPTWGETGFNCPSCPYTTQQRWYCVKASASEWRLLLVTPEEPHFWADSDTQQALAAGIDVPTSTLGGFIDTGSRVVANLFISECARCQCFAIWLHDQLVWPTAGAAPVPNPDLPADVIKDYSEAAAITRESPRGAAALLRLAVQKLCKHLGATGKGLDDYIRKWVATGLDPRVEKALDTVRIVGNNAVHPGELDVDDDPATVETLFYLINYIAEKRISEPKRIDEWFDRTVPPDEKAKIARRNRPPR